RRARRRVPQGAAPAPAGHHRLGGAARRTGCRRAIGRRNNGRRDSARRLSIPSEVVARAAVVDVDSRARVVVAVAMMAGEMIIAPVTKLATMRRHAAHMAGTQRHAPDRGAGHTMKPPPKTRAP